MNQFYDAAADYYDRLWGEQPDAAEELAFLAGWARGGPVLEVGVGTGRVAVPLARTGVRVIGVDPSPGMLSVLEAKTAQAPDLPLEARRGDMTLDGVAERFTLVYCVYHTLFYADSREEQRMFFQRSAALLAPGGVLVVEAYTPAGKRRDRWAKGMHALQLSATGYDWELYRHEEATQTVRIGRNTYDGKDVRYSYWEERYLTPEQLDEMAAAAGLRLSERWSSFARDAYRSSSGRCVSVYAPSGRGDDVD
jgi:SAM-dependent methyltransferase